MSKPRKSKKEFSKIIIITVLIFTIGITIFSCIMIWRAGDLSPLTYLIPSIFAEASTGTAFYYRKAEAENIRKIEKTQNISKGEMNDEQ